MARAVSLDRAIYLWDDYSTSVGGSRALVEPPRRIPICDTMPVSSIHRTRT
jgi:hypothetical protein